MFRDYSHVSWALLGPLGLLGILLLVCLSAWRSMYGSSQQPQCTTPPGSGPLYYFFLATPGTLSTQSRKIVVFLGNILARATNKPTYGATSPTFGHSGWAHTKRSPPNAHPDGSPFFQKEESTLRLSKIWEAALSARQHI